VDNAIETKSTSEWILDVNSLHFLTRNKESILQTLKKANQHLANVPLEPMNPARPSLPSEALSWQHETRTVGCDGKLLLHHCYLILRPKTPQECTIDLNALLRYV